jgi:hypothetical protein
MGEVSLLRMLHHCATVLAQASNNLVDVTATSLVKQTDADVNGDKGACAANTS